MIILKNKIPLWNKYSKNLNLKTEIKLEISDQTSEIEDNLDYGSQY